MLNSANCRTCLVQYLDRLCSSQVVFCEAVNCPINVFHQQLKLKLFALCHPIVYLNTKVLHLFKKVSETSETQYRSVAVYKNIANNKN